MEKNHAAFVTAKSKWPKDRKKVKTTEERTECLAWLLEFSKDFDFSLTLNMPWFVMSLIVFRIFPEI